MTEQEYEILSKLLVNLFLQSPRKIRTQKQQNIEDSQNRNEQEDKRHEEKPQEE